MAERVHLKDHLRESHIFAARSVTALVVLYLLTFIVVIRLIIMQIVDHEHFITLSESNRVSLVPIPPSRGHIYDRNGVLLADNQPTFSLEINPEQVKDIEGTITALAALFTVADSDIRRFKQALRQKRPFEGVPLRFRLSEEEVARFSVNRYRFPGVDIQARLTRDYPLGNLAVHAVGYVGRIDEKELQKLDPATYSGTMHIGKTGIEKFYENLLHGAVGYQQVEMNAYGRALRVLERTPPVAGNNLYLSLDAGMHAVAEIAFGDRRGAAVAIDTRTGEVLALVSMPGYDPNPFVNGIDPVTYKSLRNSPNRPLYNRALRGQYPPGSTVKPFLGLAALETNEITTEKITFCPGSYSLPGSTHKYRDWKREGHGWMNLKNAITQSCDVYFYNLALALGIDTMQQFLGEFGFGRKTGIDLPGELSGLVPSPEWKRAKRGEAWFSGETVITGIGQGYTNATPLQLAAATAALANRGVHFQPHLLHAIQLPNSQEFMVQKPVKTNDIRIKQGANWDAVIEAMESVVQTQSGTAFASGKGATYRIAGKTGTAQVFSVKQDERYKESEVDERLRDHALFIAFAPANEPAIAVAIILENGGHGGSVAAPIARQMMDYYLGTIGKL